MPYLKHRAYDLALELIHDRFPAFPASTVLPEKIVFVDVGASAGIQAKWLRYRRSLVPVLFEPNADEAVLLAKRLRAFDEFHVLPHALGDKAESRNLYVGEWFGCTSVLEPDEDVLRDYRIASSFATKKVVTVECNRYDELVAKGLAPRPDVIKLDIEGFESRALEGFGNLLEDVLAIETEAWFYPVYKGQALLHDLIGQLGAFGFRLCRIEEVPAFDGDCVCVNAYFLKSAGPRATLSKSQKAKFDVVSRVFRAYTI